MARVWVSVCDDRSTEATGRWIWCCSDPRVSRSQRWIDGSAPPETMLIDCQQAFFTTRNMRPTNGLHSGRWPARWCPIGGPIYDLGHPRGSDLPLDRSCDGKIGFPALAPSYGPDWWSGRPGNWTERQTQWSGSRDTHSFIDGSLVNLKSKLRRDRLAGSWLPVFSGNRSRGPCTCLPPLPRFISLHILQNISFNNHLDLI